jgi:hypothetical protein
MQMAAKQLLLRSLVRLLELVVPARVPRDISDREEALDPPVKLAIGIVLRWAQVNEVPLPRIWVVFSAERLPHSRHMRSEIHWVLKLLFAQLCKDHGKLLDQKYRFRLELAAATASRAWFLIEQNDEDEEVDSVPVVEAYAGMFDVAAVESM